MKTLSLSQEAQFVMLEALKDIRATLRGYDPGHPVLAELLAIADKAIAKSEAERRPDPQLLPCPFCGYEAKIDAANSVTCTNCAANMNWDVCEMRPDAMIKAWNRRDYHD